MARPDQARSPDRAHGLSISILFRSVMFNCFIALSIGTALLPQTVAQSPAAPPSPYASMHRDAVAYRGPGRGTANDLSGDAATIGLLLPLQGKHAAEGKLLLPAAQLALDDEAAAGPLRDVRHLALAVRDESERWGQASAEMVQLIEQEQAVALVTSVDGNIAHQAEQIANKIGIPILTLSSDATTTRINIPWIFRLGPSDADQAFLLAADIFQKRAFKKVLLIVEASHDGRVGAEEFLKAAERYNPAVLDRVEYDPAASASEPIAGIVKAKGSEAVVLWTGPEVSEGLQSVLRTAVPTVPLYLCRKASQFRSSPDAADATPIDTPGEPAARHPEFSKRYHDRVGTEPSAAAQELYDAVRLIATAIRTAGSNRARVRDYLASGHTYYGITGPISFDPAGNFQVEVIAVRSLDSAPR
jgi:branched-chain amino acid transport system substrate-binding protein